MPPISQKKKDKISEQILHYLFRTAPEQKFPSQISEEIARDEEFTKTLLEELEKKHLVVKISKNPKGKHYKRRTRWRLSNTAHKAYSKHQSK